jgi:DNA-binding beta-propeller fold protein YncE
VAVDGSKRIIVSDTGNHRLQLFDTHGGYLRGWESFGEGERFKSPQGVAVGPRGEIYVADAGNARIVVLDDAARLLGAAAAGAGADGGPDYPTGMAVTSEGRLYVADGDGDRIFVYRVEYGEPTGP